jgi:hypothetical protein
MREYKRVLIVGRQARGRKKKEEEEEEEKQKREENYYSSISSAPLTRTRTC